MARSKHQRDFRQTLKQSHQESGSTQSFNSWLKDLKSSFSQNKAEKYYNDINNQFNKFLTIYDYLETISNKMGYEAQDSYDILTDIEDRISYIGNITGLDESFLEQLFKIDDLKEITSDLTKSASNGYIFAGEEFGKIPTHSAISELIGVKVSNGDHQATIENFLLDSTNAKKFTQAMQTEGKLVLMPTRDSSGRIIDFNFGVKGTGRYDIRDTLKNITGQDGEQLPINYKDSKAVEIVNAILSGESVSILENTFNFSTKASGANYGQRAEALTRIIYNQYQENGGKVVSGDVLEQIVNKELIKVVTQEDGTEQRKFNIPAGTSGLASEDFILASFSNKIQANIPVQNKNFGDSVRVTYGSVKGVQQINGFYAGKGAFSKEADKALSKGYNASKMTGSTISQFGAQVDSEIKTLFINSLSEQGYEVTGLNESVESREEITDLIIETFNYYEYDYSDTGSSYDDELFY